MVNMMKALVFTAPHTFEYQDVPRPEPAPDEVLVEVKACAICGSDVHGSSGENGRRIPPLVMGHEFSGVIEAGHPTLAKGTPVTVYPLLSCGHCEPCQSGHPHVCNTLKLIGIDCDGGMAEYVKVPADKVVEIPAGLNLKLGAFIEPVAVGVHAVRRSGYKPGDTAVVYGAGPIGLCVAACLSYFGASRVLVIEANPYRLEIARKLGFTPIDAAHDDILAQVKAHTGGLCADYAFDCAAHPSVQNTLMDVIKVRGTAVVVGSYKKPPEVDLLKVEFKELTLIGIRVYERRDFDIAARILASGTIDFEQILTVSAPEQAPQVFQDLLKGTNAIKMLFKL